MAMASAAAALLNTGQYQIAADCMSRAKSIPGLAPHVIGYLKSTSMLMHGFNGSAPSLVTNMGEDAVAFIAQHGTPLEIHARTFLAFWLVLTGETDRAQHHVDLINSQGKQEDDEHVPVSWALEGLILVLEGRPAPGLSRTRAAVEEAGSTERNWLYPLVRLLHALAEFIAGPVDDSRAAVGQALIAARDSSMYWYVPWAVELAALVFHRDGEVTLAHRALRAVDASYTERIAEGKPPSAFPGTILHSYRLDLEHRSPPAVTQPTLAPSWTSSTTFSADLATKKGRSTAGSRLRVL